MEKEMENTLYKPIRKWKMNGEVYFELPVMSNVSKHLIFAVKDTDSFPAQIYLLNTNLCEEV